MARRAAAGFLFRELAGDHADIATFDARVSIVIMMVLDVALS